MYQVILWSTGIDYNIRLNVIKYMEASKQLKVIGLTATEMPNCKSIDGYDVINKNTIRSINFDYVIVMNKKWFITIREELNRLGISDSRILSCRFMDIPYVDFGKYIKLKNSRLSIISNNCWGGIISHTLGLEHLSPFKNLFVKDKDYIRLLGNLEHYLKCKPEFLRMDTDVHSSNQYPVLAVEDIEIHCNHEADPQNAIMTWQRRCQKINKDNLFVEMYTTDCDIAEAFVKMDKYKNKVCFVPFECTEKSLMYLPMLPGQMEFYETVNGSAGNGKNGYLYDLIELLNGEQIYRIEY